MHLRVYYVSKETDSTYMESSDSSYIDVSLLANAQLRSGSISIPSITCSPQYRLHESVSHGI